MIGVAKLLTKRGYLAPIGLTPGILANSADLKQPSKESELGNMIFPAFASVVWAIVMWLFRHDRDTLQPSLQASMQYLYNDSDKFTSVRNWLWHNK